jgi:phenylacetate-CoA ligase
VSVDAEALYQKLPIPLQNAVCSLVGWRLERTRFNAEFRRQVAAAEERARWPEDRLLEYRDRQLRAFVDHCARTVPYYRELFRREGIDPAGIRTLDDLKQLPVLTKAEVQQNYAKLLSEAVSPRQRIAAHTSGTTGGGLRFATTLDAVRRQWAVWWRYRRWHGIDRRDWCGCFGGRSVVPVSQTKAPFWRINRPGRQILFSGYHTSRENLPHYLAELRRARPPWLHGYPSLLALLAAALLEEGGDLGYPVKAVTIGAENLLPQQSQIIERAFGARPLQHYGMAEAVANISQCEQGRLHVDEDFAAVEFLTDPTPAADENGPCRVVGTNFTNPATPLLRYDVQDLATMSREGCDCGRPGRVIDDVDGRCEDYVVLPNGVRVGRMDHIFKDLVHIREAQVYQRQPGCITLRVVRGDDYTEADQQRLLLETQRRIGTQIDVQISYVDRLERSATGKLRLVVSDLQEGKVQSPHPPLSESTT